MFPNEEKDGRKWSLPSWQQLIFLVKTLSLKEKKIFLSALFLACSLFAIWGLVIYFKETDKKPALGGSYTEGIQGQPLYLNPIVARGNPVDNDLSNLIFSSLFHYDANGKLEQDLVQDWERSEDGLVYTLHLKPGVKWHDGKDLTAEDVIFTINLILNPAYGSAFRANLEGVTFEKKDDQTLVLTLKKAYTPFLHNLTFGILPKHLWGDITSDKFLLTELNRKPIGSGMYSFYKLEKGKDGKITSITLRANNQYYGEKPHLKELVFQFYADWSEILNAYSQGQIKGISYIETANLKDASKENGLKIYELPTTRVYSVFFNQQKSAVLADQKVREALNVATEKEELLRGVLEGKGVVINTPFLPNTLGFSPDLNKYEFNLEKARNILKEDGWEILNEKERKKVSAEGNANTLYNAKTKQSLSFTLTVANYPELIKTADLLKKQWEQIGVNIVLDITDTSETLQTKISERNYEALLFGEVLQADPDPTPFWHSNSKQSPGLNLALFDDKEADSLLDQARQEVSEQKRAELYHAFGEIINQKTPAIFLFSPSYLYGVFEDYKDVGVKIIYDSSDRLDDIAKRYLFVSRTRK